MKIVLKPGGVILILVAVFGLSLLAVRSRKISTVPRTIVAQNIVVPLKVVSQEFLPNGGFEGDYSICRKIDVAHGVDITGVIANSWADNSGWGRIGLRYEKDDVNPYSGRSAQKITVQSIGSAYTQLVQYVDVPQGTVVEGRIWARSDVPLKASDAGIVLRKIDAPGTIYADTPMLLTTKWESFTLRGTVRDTGKAMFIVYVRRAGVSVWLDEASLHIAP